MTAAEHLGSEQLPVRLGGIYALWRLAEDSPERDEKTVWDILCAFVRVPPHEAIIMGSDVARPDVQAILGLLKTNAAAAKRKRVGYKLDLSGADISGAYLNRANLIGDEFFGADLSKANLIQADLSGAEFNMSILNEADFQGALNLTQEQLDTAYADPERPPKNLPEGLVWRCKACPE